MKFSSLAVQESPGFALQQKVVFPSGIVGFPDFREAEIIYQPSELPFMWLKGSSKDKISFIVVDPAGLVQNYEVELSDTDVESMGIKSPADALILNIATLHKGPTSRITLNLIGPIVINRSTLLARQVIIANCQKYSAQHLLFETH